MHDTYKNPVLLSFGLHLILTAIFVMQDNVDIKKLVFDAIFLWKTLFEKL